MQAASTTSQSTSSTSNWRLRRAPGIKIDAQRSLLPDGDNIVVAQPKKYAKDKIDHPDDLVTSTEIPAKIERPQLSSPSLSRRSNQAKNSAFRSAKDDYGDFLIYYVVDRKYKNCRSHPSSRTQHVSSGKLAKHRQSRARERTRRTAAAAV